jgi:hypothetical protein
MDQFIDLRDVKHVLELHTIIPGEPYFVGIFLVGAYQEVLGDLHNLFGDIDAVHVFLDETGYHVEHVVEGDTVQEVLAYMQYSRSDLVQRVRRAVEVALREKRISLDDSGRLMQRYEQGLSGYTYLTVEDNYGPAAAAHPGPPALLPAATPAALGNGTNGANGSTAPAAQPAAPAVITPPYRVSDK